MLIEIHQSDDNFEITENIVHVIEVAPFGQPDGVLENIFTAKGQLIGASAADTPVAIPAAAADGYTLIADGSQTSGIRWGNATVTVEDTTNYLVNGGFPFAQRQAPGTDTTIADETYGPDRWCCTRETAALQYSRQDASSETGLTSRYYGKFTKITNDGKFMVFQPLTYENSIPMRGRTVIFQVQMKASAAKTIKIAILELQTAGTADTLPAALVTAWNVDTTDPTLGANIAVVASGSCSVTTSWQNFSVSGAVPANSKNLIVAIWTDADFTVADTLSMAEAGLYRGSTTQAWAPRQRSEEIRLCQHHYCKSFKLDTAPAQNIGTNLGDHIFNAITAGATISRTSTILYPVTMKATPTITTFNTSAANAETRDVTAAADCSSTTQHNLTETGFAIYCTGHATTAIGDRLSFHWTAEAEL